ncbi:hypothetical protein L218DRAFT_895759 [Marasmius fiardii PR-910]|nr:hypothetical protein L218DRAFT_895759 [Marasmius fiardii PR-910]
MPPSDSKFYGSDVIEISDSEPELSTTAITTAEIHPSKRRKVTQGSVHCQSPTMANANLATKNNHLKGRKRFKADMEDMKEACNTGFTAHGLKLTKFRSGDEDGSFEAYVSTTGGESIVAVNFLVSDTSDYPKDHSYFAHSLESNPPTNIQDVVENISTFPAQSISETVENMLSNLSKAMTTGDATMDSESEDDDEEGYEAYDVDDEFEGAHYAVGTNSRIQLGRMQHDFIDTVASLYRPGLIRFGQDDFCISVSLSVVELAESIPPRALMAWDRRLLSRSQHLVLLISGFRGAYPSPDFIAGARQTTPLTFKVGLSGKYKPGKDQAREAQRNYGLILKDAEDELRAQKEKEKQEALAALYEWDGEGEDPMASADVLPTLEEEEVEEEDEDEERFDRFSLSSSLESLMDQNFHKLVNIRRRHKIGWAGAELLLWEVEQNQVSENEIIVSQAKLIKDADREERNFADIKNLPHDPLMGLGPAEDINVPLTAFCYLIRRLILCTRFCLVCHRRLGADYEALKPYVCGSKLCAYQYYALNKGPSLEYEIIHNPRSVDLLVSLTYSAAVEGALDDPLPVGLGLQVPEPDTSRVFDASVPMNAAVIGIPPVPSPAVTQRANEVISLNTAQSLHDFDALGPKQMRATIAQLIDSLPSIDDMRKHLVRKRSPGKPRPKLVECDPTVLPAAWQVLRWIVGSCTAYLEEITDPSENIRNIDRSWRQYRFSVGAPDAEAKFKESVEKAQAVDVNCRQYPSLFAFHGSPLKNWHSIIRHGLWFKNVAHGRAYGDGVYMAKEGTVSLGTYSMGRSSGAPSWRKSKVGPNACAALVEVVNQPSQFVSSNPYFVVQHTQWLICRYLLVKAVQSSDLTSGTSSNTVQNGDAAVSNEVPYVRLDPKHPITLNNAPIEIPQPGHKIEAVLHERHAEAAYQDDEMDANDQEVFNHSETADGKGKGKEQVRGNGQLDMDFEMNDGTTAGTAHDVSAQGPKIQGRPTDDWVHDAEYVQQAVSLLMPPPTDASPVATMAVQREMRQMLKEQENCKSFKDLGWYMPPDLIGDNLFQWIVEMHTFDESLPIAKDLKREGVNSVIFEIRFPPDFPLSPPFFRIITPRFLPFIHGGGGHVTGGGSICMDLLTASGWLPSYSISAILIQIKLAISNPDPRPARLLGGDGWKRPYSVFEALEGYKRAASTHGWKLPSGLERLVR